MTASIRLATLVVFTISMIVERSQGGHEVVVGFTDLSGVTTATPGSTVKITVGVLEGRLHPNETVHLLLTTGRDSAIVDENSKKPLHRPIELTMAHPLNTSKVVILNTAQGGTEFPVKLTTPETDSTGDVVVTFAGFFSIKITDVPDGVRTYIAYIVGFAALIAAVGAIVSIIFRQKRRKLMAERTQTN